MIKILAWTEIGTCLFLAVVTIALDENWLSLLFLFLLLSGVLMVYYCQIRESKKIIHNLNLDLETLFQEKKELESDYLEKMEHLRCTVSHSMKMPLSIMKGYVGLLEHHKAIGDSGKQEYIAKIENHITFLGNVANQMLLDLKVSGKESVSNFKKTDVINCIDGILKDSEGIAKKRGIILQLNAGMDSLWIDCDETQIKQMFYNLLEFSFLLVMRFGVINVTVSQVGENEILIVYKDNGEGLLQKEVASILESNYEDFGNREKSGMSLNMVKRIVAAHSGSIEVRSEKQKGLSIYINLPIIQKIFG